MFHLISMGIEIFSSAVFVVPAVILLQYAVLRQRSISKMAAVMVFAFYLTAVFSVTGIPTVTSWHIHPEFNLIPLIDIVNSPLAYIRNTVLNIILFMPLGYLVPVVWKEYRSLRTVFLMGLLLSVLIEVLQIFTFRLTDVDDLITNTAGSVLGFYVGKLVSFRLPWKLPEDSGGNYHKYEPVMVLAAVLLTGIIFKPFVSNMLWDEVLVSELWESIK